MVTCRSPNHSGKHQFVSTIFPLINDTAFHFVGLIALKVAKLEEVTLEGNSLGKTKSGLLG